QTAPAPRLALSFYEPLLRLARHVLEQRRHAHAGTEFHRLAGRAHFELLTVAAAARSLLALCGERVVGGVLRIGNGTPPAPHPPPPALLLPGLSRTAGLDALEQVFKLRQHAFRQVLRSR